LLNANEENEQLVDLLAGSDAPVIVTGNGEYLLYFGRL
jgi:hypothetical protein